MTCLVPQLVRVKAGVSTQALLLLKSMLYPNTRKLLPAIIT